jgi:hypothetical protein
MLQKKLRGRGGEVLYMKGGLEGGGGGSRYAETFKATVSGSLSRVHLS